MSETDSPRQFQRSQEQLLDGVDLDTSGDELVDVIVDKLLAAFETSTRTVADQADDAHALTTKWCRKVGKIKPAQAKNIAVQVRTRLEFAVWLRQRGDAGQKTIEP